MQAGEIHSVVVPSLYRAKFVRTDAETLAALLFLREHAGEWHVWSVHQSWGAANVASARLRNRPHKKLRPYSENLRWKTDFVPELGPGVLVLWAR